jgi:hypothetical protein
MDAAKLQQAVEWGVLVWHWHELGHVDGMIQRIMASVTSNRPAG